MGDKELKSNWKVKLMDTIKEFKEAKKYRKWSWGAGALVPLTVFIVFSEFKIMGYILMALFMFAHVYFGLKFKCPACSNRLDLRTPLSNLVYCPKCSVQLQEKNPPNWTGIS